MTHVGHSRSRFQAGFTLVELLVVIGIIALLISILLPTLNRARESANTAKCLANQRSVTQASIMFASERGVLPTCSDDGLAKARDPFRKKYDYRTTSAGQAVKDWASMLLRYMGDRSPEATLIDGTGTRSASIQIFQCPSDPGLFRDQDPGYLMYSNFVATPTNGNGFVPISMGINADIVSLVGDNGIGYWTLGQDVGVMHGPDPRNAYGLHNGYRVGQPLEGRMSRIKGSSEVALFMDVGNRPHVGGQTNAMDRSDILYFSSHYAVYGNGPLELSGTLEGMSQASWLGNKIAANRHSPKNGPGGTVLPNSRRVNVTFADGHGETAGRERWSAIRVSPFNPVAAR
jgi:prepilin-type N-terminal cleavage/methylation domain-containing protein/prepilin-type processing-associated H-X9-DG protein